MSHCAWVARVLSLIEGENWEIVLTDFRPALSHISTAISFWQGFSLEYRLTQQIQPVVSVTVKLEQFKHDSQDIVSTLINPIITKHLNLFHQLLDSEIPQAHKEDTPNEQAEPKSAPAQSSPPVDDSAPSYLTSRQGFASGNSPMSGKARFAQFWSRTSFHRLNGYCSMP